MSYKLADSLGDSISVPQIVFSRLADIEDDWARVALYIINTKDTDAANIARALRLKSAEKAKEALLFWKGAGLLTNDDAQSALAVSEQAQQSEGGLKEKHHLTTPQVAAAAEDDSAIPALLQECQSLLGGVLRQTDANIVVSMYVQDGLPPDLILTGIAHCAALGKRSAAYAERVLHSWQAQGIETGEDAEKYLQLLALRKEREARVAEIFGLENAKFTKKDAMQIADWYEEFGYDDTMIAEAVGFAGDKKTVSYTNGILRNWYSKGYKTVRDVMSSNVDKMQNIQATNPKTTDVLSRGLHRAPVFKKQGREI